ncbi:MAG: hypothetical protein ACRDY3_08485 [Acidimicrobiales bacterium]
MVDGKIVTVARRHGAAILASDAGMSRLARMVGIDLDDASPTA